MELVRALKERFAPPEWALFFEVSNSTGGQIRRYADAVAMCLYPSRGFEVHGIEIKSSRSDWQRELKDPAKSNAVQKYCDRWWIVANGPDIVKDFELPKTWGLMVFKDESLRVKVQAPQLKPEPLAPGFIASLVRRFHEDLSKYVRRDEIQSEINSARETERLSWKTVESTMEAGFRRQLNEVSARIDRFEKQSGVKIDDWTHNVGACFRRFLNEARGGDFLLNLRNEKDRASRAVEELQKCIAEIEAMGKAQVAEISKT